jgi:sulfite reductase (ferredoxin)
VFIPPDGALIADVFRKIVHIFRDQDQLRQGRLKARLKFYVDKIGWEAFRGELERYLGYTLEHDENIVGPVGAGHDDHVGVGSLKSGLSFVGVAVPRGRMTGDQMIGVAELAGKYCEHPERQINTTIKQNLLLLNIRPERASDLCKELQDIELPVESHPLRRQLISCTGTQFCNLAVVETKERALGILEYLEKNVPMDQPVFISVTGCPNSCVQYQIADIGLQGTLYTYRGEKGVEHYHILVGGRMGTEPAFARFICSDDAETKKIKVPAQLVHLAIERLIRAWQGDRVDGQKFAQWAQKQPMKRLAACILIEQP